MNSVFKQTIEVASRLPLCVLITDNNRNILFINEMAEKLTGYKSSELEGKKCKDFFGQDCISLGQDCFLIHPEGVRSTHINIKNKNGDPLTIEKDVRTLTDKDGIIIGGIEMFKEVTDMRSDHAHLKREFRYLEESLRKWKEIIEVGLTLTSSLSLHRVLLRTVTILKNTFNYENIVVLLANDEDDGLEIWARSGLPDDPDFEPGPVLKGKGIIGKCFEKGKPFLVNDVLKDNDYVAANSKILSELSIPIIHQDKTIGVINAESTKLNYFSDEDIKILTVISNFAASAIHNAQLTKEIASAREQYKSLFNESSDPILITDIATTGFLACNSSATKLYGYTEEEFMKISPAMLLDFDSLEDTTPEATFSHTWEGVHLTKDKHKIYVETKSSLIDYKQEKAYLTIVRDISERKDLEEQLIRQSETDELTMLYNRRYFIKAINNEILRAERYNQPLTLAMIDVDKFKEYNDEFGHQSGDALLTKIGSIMKDIFRMTDIPCRYGGDEFSIIFPHTGMQETEAIAKRLQVEYAKYNFADTSLSIGIAAYTRGNSTEVFLRKADRSLYHVKQTLGRGKIAVYDVDLIE
ncbi:MAG: diguanylate cyclase [Acidobacteria bacterium]|nr:diguanylate cyclase [Acidobacteriota bacterium]